MSTEPAAPVEAGQEEAEPAKDGQVGAEQPATPQQPTERPVPAISAVERFVAVSSGLAHSCGLRADGIIDCWGLESAVTPPAGAPAA